MSSMSAFTPSNRHSLHLYATLGPKPLQLVDGPPSALSSPTTFTTPVHSPSSLNQNKPRASRRQSSVSYKRSSYDSLTQSRPVDSSPQPQHGLIREKPRPRSVAYPSTLLLTPPAVEDRPPLTLADKHADLLQFIAQKESKCLELRSQLAVHEAELLQLKRTWERIVSRSFEFPHSTLPIPTTTSAPATPSQPGIHTPYSSNVVLEGIKEGVQGVSRLIASGLSISNADHPNPPPPTRPSPKPRPHSLYFPLSSSPSPSSHIRSPNLSTSSTCTTATSATRFSASPSSASTFFEEHESWGDDAEQKQLKAGGQGDDPGRDAPASRNRSPDSSCSQELMVRDTGATPTVSPNPKFEFGMERRRERERNEREQIAGDGNGGWSEAGISILDGLSKDEQREGTLRALTANSSAVRIDAGSTRCHRRKSRETSASACGYLRPGDDDESGAPTRFSPSSRSSSPVSAAILAGDDLRLSMHTRAPSPAAVPKHPAESPQTHLSSSWTKRWTLGKSQKRASVLLSDVSQTLVSAFSLAAGTASLGSSAPASVPVSASSAWGASAKPASMSLLDDDEDSAASAVLQPMKPVVVGAPGSNASRMDASVRIAISTDDDDAEWNW